MICLQCGIQRVADVQILIDACKETKHGIVDNMKSKMIDRRQSANECIKTVYHILPDYRVFSYNDNPDKVYNMNLPNPPLQVFLKFNCCGLPVLALLSQLPTHLYLQYIKWRRLAIISLRRDGRKYHENMVKAVYASNVFQMSLMIYFSERAFQLFLQLYIITHSDRVSPLQLTQIFVGLVAMLFSFVYTQTTCAYMTRNLWENGLKAYIGGLMAYVAMLLLALVSILVIFVYASVYKQFLVYITFALFLILVTLHLSRGIIKSVQPMAPRIVKIIFWVLFVLFLYSDFYWYKCLMTLNVSATISGLAPDPVVKNSTLEICEDARLGLCNFNTTYRSTLEFLTNPVSCISTHYEKLYYILNTIPYLIILLSFISPLHKGFEYFYGYKSKNNTPKEEGLDEMASYYKSLKRRLAVNGSPSVVVGPLRKPEVVETADILV